MPIKSCTLPSGKSGYKYGDSGKCYSSKKDAIKQMVAIKMSGYKESKASLCEEEGITEAELNEVIASLSLEEQVLLNLRNK